MSDKIDRDLLLSLADLLKETGLGELEVEVDGLRVRLAQPANHQPRTRITMAPITLIPYSVPTSTIVCITASTVF